jgi:hypothetical protein
MASARSSKGARRTNGKAQSGAKAEAQRGAKAEAPRRPKSEAVSARTTKKAKASAKKATPRPKPKTKTKPAATKPAVAKPAAAAIAKPAMTAPKVKGDRKLVGTAGKQILEDLGLTDAELAAFIPPEAPKWVRGVFWCQLELGLTLEEIARHFEGRYVVERYDDLKFPEDGPEEGISVRSVTLRPKGRYASYTFYGMRGDRYVEDGCYQLEAAFRESGTIWGSNRAIYERFKALELPALGATNVSERTE